MKWNRKTAGHYTSDTGCVVKKVPQLFSYSAPEVWQAEVRGAEVPMDPIFGRPNHPRFRTLAQAKEHCEAHSS